LRPGQNIRVSEPASPPNVVVRHHRLRRMSGRDPHEPHRVAVPLELLFDLTFVIAFCVAASQLAQMLASGTSGRGRPASASPPLPCRARGSISVGLLRPMTRMTGCTARGRGAGRRLHRIGLRHLSVADPDLGRVLRRRRADDASGVGLRERPRVSRSFDPAVSAGRDGGAGGRRPRIRVSQASAHSRRMARSRGAAGPRS
jgi:hypothetical protein